MRAARSLLAAGAVASAIALVVPGTATANTVGTPIIADLNADGLPDRVVLGPDSPTPTCTLTVEHGKRDGTYKPPVTKTFTSPWTVRPYCPNMGVAINLGPSRQMELVLTQFSYYGSGGATALMVLKGFDPVALFPGINYPSHISAADLDGDGRTDLFESSDESMRFSLFYNRPTGSLAAGPSVCSSRPAPQYEMADYNADGGQDFLLATMCFTGTNTAQVLFGDGQAPAVLDSSTTATFRVFKLDADGDGITDAGVIRTEPGGAVSVRLFRNDGHGAFTEVPLTAAARSRALTVRATPLVATGVHVRR